MTRNMQAAQAKDLLTHYFRVTSKGPWNYDGDSTAEIEQIIDLIIRAATREMSEEIKRLEARISSLETSNLMRRNGEVNY